MQTAEKVTKKFIFKILALFALLLVGGIMKATKLSAANNAPALSQQLDSTPTDDTQKPMQQLYIQLVKH